MRLRAGRRERASEGYLLSMFPRRFALLARLCVGRREFLRDDSDKQANGFLDGFYGLRSFFFSYKWRVEVLQCLDGWKDEKRARTSNN